MIETIKDSHIHKLIQSKRYWIKHSEDATHYIMAGGIIHVPEDDMMLFFEAMTKDIKKYGFDINGLLERRSSITRLYFDLDFEYEKENYDNMGNIIKYIHKCVCNIVNMKNTPMVSLTRDWSIKKEKWHKGYHLIFKDIFVDIPMALGIRERLVCKLLKTFPEFPWEQFIDIDVITNGLRMPFALHYKDRKPSIGNYYILDDIYGKFGKNSDIKNNVLNLIQSTHIRLPESVIPNVDETLRINIVPKAGPVRDNINLDNYDLDKQTWIKIFETIVDYEFNDRKIYKDLKIKKISIGNISLAEEKFDIKKCYHVNVQGPGSRFCINKTKEHNSATIYFRVTRLDNQIYICQRCFCKCKKKKPIDECRNFTHFIDSISI